MAVYPVPAGRSSDVLMSRRLLSQLQAEQKRLLQVNQQLGTGRRIQLPSEDPSAAGRAVSLQRLLEGKTQLKTNLATSQSYLDATDTALMGVADLLANARGLAVLAADSTTSELERKAMAIEIESTITQMLNVGNQKFRGRHLFAGTDLSGNPFESIGAHVVYAGNDVTYRSLADTDLLFETNVPGQDLFGAVSAEVKGIDLNANLNAETRLSDLHGGQGITAGSFLISDGTNTSTVSLAGARTMGDVVRLIEAGAPLGRVVQATIGTQGMTISMNDGLGGSLTVSDLEGGSTAAELGIKRLSGVATDPIVGADLNPILRLTTRLDALAVGGGGAWDQASGLQIKNGETTHVIDLQSAETVEDLLNILNASDAKLLAEINADQNGINVRSRLSGADFSIGENGGTTATDLGLRTFTDTTSLAELNYRQGVTPAPGTDFVIHRNDGVDLEIDISSARTIGDVLDLINNHPDNLDPTTAVVARLQAFGNGIELVNDNPSGGESLTVSRVIGSNTAWELGLVAWGEDSSLADDPPAQAANAIVSFTPPNDLNTAIEVTAVLAGTGWNGVDIELRNTLAGDVATATFDPVGRRLIIDMANGQTTANTMISAIVAEGTFTATLDLTSDPTNSGLGTLVAPAGIAATTAGGTSEAIAARDTNPLETQGVFNSLLRLRDAIDNYDIEDLQRIVEMLDVDFDRLNFGRAAVGTRNQGLDAMGIRNDDDQIELKAALSQDIDMDLAEAATEFAARQAAYEASLRTIANMFQLSLLDFI